LEEFIWLQNTLFVKLNGIVALRNLFLGKKNWQSFFERLQRISLKGLNYGRASDYRNNGETEALARVAQMIKSDHAVLFDVGGNKGEFTKRIIESWAGRTYDLHVFEPSRNTFAILNDAVRNTKASGTVHLHNLGLGDKVGKAELFYDREGSGLASVYHRDLSFRNISFEAHETIELTTLDTFCEAYGIAAIDFLKLDVEGHELAVLRGGAQMFKAGKVRVVQFEFGGCNIDSRTFFRDYYHFFEKDFKLYRILSDGLHAINKYSEKLEVFESANYLAVRQTP
jgi:FkbM family methyltransferase